MFYRELLVPLLNPFSEEAKKIVQASPPLYSLPPELAQEAVNRVLRPAVSLFTDKKSVEREVLSFYLACAGVASVSHPYSMEARLLENAVKQTVKGRMFELFKKGYEDCCLEAVRSFIKIEPISGRTIRGKRSPREITSSLGIENCRDWVCWIKKSMKESSCSASRNTPSDGRTSRLYSNTTASG